MPEHGSHERWWLAMCEEYGQDPDDPDAFCTVPPDDLQDMMEKALREHGSERRYRVTLALWTSRADLRHKRLEDDRAELEAFAAWLLAVADGDVDPLRRPRSMGDA